MFEEYDSLFVSFRDPLTLTAIAMRHYDAIRVRRAKNSSCAHRAE